MRYIRKYNRSTNDGLYDWAANFSTRVVAVPSSFGLVAGQVSGLAALVAAYRAALDVQNGPNHSNTTTQAFNVAKQNLLNYILPVAQIVSNTPETSVPRANKVAVDVNPMFTRRGIAGADVQPATKIEVTDSAPYLTIKPEDNLTLKFTYHASGAGMRRGSQKVKSSAKPIGAATLQVFYKMTPPTAGQNPYNGMVPMATATKSPFTFTFDGGLGGRTAYIACRWVSPRGVYGPWSGIQPCTIPILGSAIVTGPLPGQ